MIVLPVGPWSDEWLINLRGKRMFYCCRALYLVPSLLSYVGGGSDRRCNRVGSLRIARSSPLILDHCFSGGPWSEPWSLVRGNAPNGVVFYLKSLGSDKLESVYKSYTKKLKTVRSLSRTRSENYKEWVSTSETAPRHELNYVDNGKCLVDLSIGASSH